MKKKGTPALLAERVWQAVRDGSLEQVEAVPGTRLLLVRRGRIRLTWRDNGRVRHARTRLRRVWLNPRWIPLPRGFDAAELWGLDHRQLARRGIIRRGRDDFRLLIYQQLNDLPSLLRQLEEHILPQYEREEAELWQLFSRMDLRATLGLAEAPQDLQDALLGRVEQIGTIRTHMAARAEAVRTRLKRFQRLREHIRGGLEMVLGLLPREVADIELEGAVIGIANSLERHHHSLTPLLADEPFAGPARWARYHLREARDDLLRHDFDGAARHLQKAIEHLR